MDEMNVSELPSCETSPLWEIERTRLLTLLSQSPDPLVVARAPSGYGKTSMIRQAVDCGGFATVLWIDLPTGGVTPLGLCESVLASLAVALDRPALDSAEVSGAEFEVVADALRLLRGQRCALVMDNVAGQGGSAAVGRVAALFLRAAGSGSRVFAATRDSAALGEFGLPFLALDTHDLLFDSGEARALLNRVCPGANEGAICDLVDLAVGHAATLLVVGRQLALADAPLSEVMRHGPHLKARLRVGASSMLDPEARRTLLACALLGRGTDYDLKRLLGSDMELGSVAQCIPLVSFEETVSGDTAFRAHDLVFMAFNCRTWARSAVPDSETLARRAIDLLTARGDNARVLFIATEFEPETLAEVIEARGAGLLDAGSPDLVLRALERIPLDELVKRPRLLCIEAEVRLALGDFGDALRKGSVARTLASHAGDYETELAALEVIESVHYRRGDFDSSVVCLESISRAAKTVGVSSAHLAVVDSRLALVHAQRGQATTAGRHSALARGQLAGLEGPRGQVTAVCFRLAGVDYLVGRTSVAASSVTALLRSTDLPVALRLEGICNLLDALTQQGRIRRAQVLALEGEQLARDYALSHVESALRGSRSALMAAEGSFRESLAESKKAIGELVHAGDLLNANYERLWRALLLAATGDLDNALSEAEEALEYFATTQATVFIWQAVLELSACMLALGDDESARAQVEGVRRAVQEAGYPQHLLRADLILAEADRLLGQTDDAVERLASHRDYILGGDANWTVAMTLRVFPGLLGVMDEAVAPAQLPLHLLRMVGRDRLDEAVASAREWMEAPRVEKLAERARRSTPERPVTAPVPVTPAATCSVRLFGGLEVSTPHGPIGERDWKKRKARLLFAMLCARRGRDVPRDQLFEYLWPEMDDERARNNFYVVFNAMKTALTAGKGKGQPCPYVLSRAGVCSIDTSTVRTDLDDFDETLASARTAESAGDGQSAVDAYARLAEIYRGDLLPGDVYDDWFSPLREKYRHEFSDAMVRGGRLLADAGDLVGALHLIRQALSHDAWREDLYQAAIRYQISAGQRSAAVDTYHACRSRLAEDLGLDPSADTRRLYDEILAMEE